MGGILITPCDCTGGGGVPAPPVNSVQFNDAGAFGGSALFLWDATPDYLTILDGGGISVAGSGASSEKYGIGTTADGDNSIILGAFSSADVASINSIVIGASSAVTAPDSIAIGAGLTLSGQNSVFIRVGSGNPTSNYAVGIGSGTGGDHYSVAIGANSNGETGTVCIGYQASAARAYSVQIGYNVAGNSGTGGSVVIGDNTTVGGGSSGPSSGLNVIIGSAARTDTSYASVVIGSSAYSGNNYNIAVGFFSSTDTFTNSAAIGREVTCTASKQVIIGNFTDPYTEFVLGGDPWFDNPEDVIVRISDITGNDNTGKNLTIRPGNGTGEGGSGQIIFQTAPGNASSGVQDTYVTAIIIYNNQNLFFQGKIINYNQYGTVLNGVPIVFGEAAQLSQTAATGTITPISSVTSTGYYRLTYTAVINRAASVSSILGGATGFQVTYTDGDNNVSKTTPVGATSTANTTATMITGSVLIFAITGSAVTYAFGYTSAGGTTMQYNLRVLTEFLG